MYIPASDVCVSAAAWLNMDSATDLSHSLTDASVGFKHTTPRVSLWYDLTDNLAVVSGELPLAQHT